MAKRPRGKVKPEREPREEQATGKETRDDRLAKIRALSALNNINPKARAIWLLITAGFTWDETRKILHVSKATIRDVLAGKELAQE